MAPRRNTWHRSSLSEAQASAEDAPPGRPVSAAPRFNKLSWQRSNLQPAGHSIEQPSAALSFSQQVAWIHKQGPVSTTALPRQRDFDPGPSRLSRGSQHWSANGPPPIRAAMYPSRLVGSRQWVRPSQESQNVDTSRPAAPKPCVHNTAVGRPRAEAPATTNIPAALGTSAGPPQLQPLGAALGNATSVSKASSDSSIVSAASSIQLTSQGIDSTRPQGAQVPVSSALQPRSSLQYANSRNGLALRRVSVSTKKAQRQQQHLMQHTLHQQPADQASTQPAPSIGSPCLKPVSVLQTFQETPRNKEKLLSRPLFTPPIGNLAPGQPHSQTPVQQLASNASKRKLPLGSTAAKRPRTSSKHMQSPSRSRKLQRLGNELYSSSGKGTLFRKGSKAVSKGHSRTATEGSQPAAKAAVYARQGRQLVRLTPSMTKATSGRGTAKRRRSSLSRPRPASARPRAPSKIPEQCLLYSRTGKCEAARQGRCSCSHDPKKITICGRWLRGTCSRPNCPLQHCLQPHLLPVCTFYLQGMCSNEDCPYLHVNLDPAAPVCRDFVRGYCPRGAVCPHKHLTPKMVRELRANKSLNIGCLASSRKVSALQSQPKPSRSLASCSSDLMKPAFLRDLDEDDALDTEGLCFNLD